METEMIPANFLLTLLGLFCVGIAIIISIATWRAWCTMRKEQRQQERYRPKNSRHKKN